MLTKRSPSKNLVSMMTLPLQSTQANTISVHVHPQLAAKTAAAAKKGHQNISRIETKFFVNL